MEFKNIEILLVEDNIHEAKLTMLSLEGCRLSNNIYHVEDGAEALDFLFAKRKYEGRIDYKNPRLILLDLKLPKINRLEVLKELRSNERTRRIPVVIFTSSGADRDVIAGYELGANSYIVKPVEFKLFEKTVSELRDYWAALNVPPVN